MMTNVAHDHLPYVPHRMLSSPIRSDRHFTEPTRENLYNGTKHDKEISPPQVKAFERTAVAKSENPVKRNTKM